MTIDVAERAIAAIKDEHRMLGSMLRAMQALAARYRDSGGERDFALLEAMLLYIEKVPDLLHHPKEDELLFGVLRRHSRAGEKLIEELAREHARDGSMVAGLRSAFRAFRQGAGGNLDQIVLAVDQFAVFHESHIRKEEELLLPLAIAHLTGEEWQRVAHAFGDDLDTPGGTALAGDYNRLYECIAQLVPPLLRLDLETARKKSGEPAAHGARAVRH